MFLGNRAWGLRHDWETMTDFRRRIDFLGGGGWGRPRRSVREEKETKKGVHAFLIKCAKQMRMETVVIAAAATMCQRYYALVSMRKIHRFVSKPAGRERVD